MVKVVAIMMAVVVVIVLSTVIVVAVVFFSVRGLYWPRWDRPTDGRTKTYRVACPHLKRKGSKRVMYFKELIKDKHR